MAIVYVALHHGEPSGTSEAGWSGYARVPLEWGAEQPLRAVFEECGEAADAVTHWSVHSESGVLLESGPIAPKAIALYAGVTVHLAIYHAEETPT